MTMLPLKDSAVTRASVEPTPTPAAVRCAGERVATEVALKPPKNVTCTVG